MSECFLGIRFMGKESFVRKMVRSLKGFGNKINCYGNCDKKKQKEKQFIIYFLYKFYYN